MKKKTFIALFVSTHLVFILLVIFKQNKFISLTYQKQRKETLKESLIERKKELTQKVYAHNHAQVKQYARKRLHMEPLSINQVRKIS